MFQYGKNFWILCYSMFLFMTSFNLIIPELNGFITRLDGQDYKGLIIILFTVTAAISRPFSGKLSDTIGRKKVMIIGVLISILACALYPFSSLLSIFLCLRLLHGFCAGFFPTGATALLTDILPKDHRGKGMGVWGMFISLGIGIGQGTGSLISDTYGTDNLFFIASITALISGILLHNVKETLSNAESFKLEHLKITIDDVFEPSVQPAGIVMFLSATCSGIIFVVTPDISTYLNTGNKGWFFIFYVLTTIFIRLFFGSLSDKIGRVKTLTIGMFFLCISMIMLSFSKDIVMYSVSSIVFGIATGISSPTLFAWTADLSHPERIGIGTGTMFISLELGIMAGAASTLLTFDNSMKSIGNVFVVGVLFSAAAFLYLIIHDRTNKRKAKLNPPS
jgi:MFS family permease